MQSGHRLREAAIVVVRRRRRFRLLLLPPPPSAAAVSFLGQFGNDAASSDLRRALTSSGVRIPPRSGTSRVHPSGRGYVMVVPGTGEVCAVVSGGSNLYGWGRWGAEEEEEEKTTRRRRR